MMSDFETIKEESTGELTLKGSRFIGVALPCPSENTIQENLDILSKRWRDATHYCWAAIYDGSQRRERSSDNGEPSGTAGKPIMNVLKGSGLTDTMVVVIRYFGGTLLGTGGLVHAYTEGAKLALVDARRISKRACCVYTFHLDYAMYNAFITKMSDIMMVPPECEYTERVDIKARIPVERRDEFLKRLSDLTERKTIPTQLPDEYI